MFSVWALRPWGQLALMGAQGPALRSMRFRADSKEYAV